MRRVSSAYGIAIFLILFLMCGSVWAGMRQSGPMFNLPGPGAAGASAEYQAPMPGGPPGGPGGAAPTMQLYTDNQAKARALMGKPAAVERKRTTVTLDLVAKYGDEEDKDLRRYEATFKGKYTVASKEKLPKKGKPKKMTVVIYFPFPTSADTVPEASLKIDGKEPANVTYRQDGVSCQTTFLPEQQRELDISYRAFGTEDFAYALDHDQRIEALDFQATITGTQRKPELPPKTCLEPSKPLTRSGNVYNVSWQYKDLLTAREIIIILPAPVVRSDIDQRMRGLLRTGVLSIVLFALFLGSGAAITGKRIGFAQYLLIGVGLLLFFFLLRELATYTSVYRAFGLGFVVTSGLVIWNLSRTQGRRFAWTYGAFGLVAIVGLFSVASLMTKGSSTVITIAILMLVAYLMYAAPRMPALHLRQPRPPAPPPLPPPVEELPAPPPPAPAQPEEVAEETPEHCPHCGRSVAGDFQFCPGCGRPAKVTQECSRCGRRICTTCRPNYQYCPGCGVEL